MSLDSITMQIGEVCSQVYTSVPRQRNSDLRPGQAGLLEVPATDSVLGRGRSGFSVVVTSHHELVFGKLCYLPFIYASPGLFKAGEAIIKGSIQAKCSG